MYIFYSYTKQSLFILIFLFSCLPENQTDSIAINLQQKTRWLINFNNNKKSKLLCEVANTQAQRSRGLMFRTHLNHNEGMIFVFDTEQVANFWMKSTYIPLSIAFINTQNTITKIANMEPNTETITTSVNPIIYAIETNQGWFEQKSIKVGHKIMIKKSD